MSRHLSPIVIFAFNRPKHLSRLLDSLSKNMEFVESELYIYVDGPRNNSDVKLVEETRQVAKHFQGVNVKSLVIREENLGLGKSLKTGVTELLSKHDKLIVLEDDLIVTDSFLKYMNTGLNKYQLEPRVASIHGYCFGFDQPIKDPFFLKGADCLGWATWTDRWESINWDPKVLMAQIQKQGLVQEFNLDGSYSYYSALESELKKGFHSWAIYWHASMFSQGRLTLFPGTSLIEYAGADGSGTHVVVNSGFWNTEISKQSEWNFPEVVSESGAAREQLITYYNRIFPKLPFIGRLIRRIKFELKRRLKFI